MYIYIYLYLVFKNLNNFTEDTKGNIENHSKIKLSIYENI